MISIKHAAIVAGVLALGVHLTLAQDDDQPNAIGYLNKDIDPGFQLLSIPLNVDYDAIDLDQIFLRAPEGLTIYKLASGTDGGGTPLAQLPELNAFLQSLPERAQGLVTVTRAAQKLSLEWEGELESASDVEGPFQKVSEPGSMEIEANHPRRFFRASVALKEDLRFIKNERRSSGWELPGQTFELGEGFILHNPQSERYLTTFVGKVLEEDWSVPVAAGLSLISSKVPVEGGLASRMQFDPPSGTRVFVRNEEGVLSEFSAVRSGGLVEWTPEEPRLNAADAMFVWSPVAFEWRFDMPQLGFE